MASKKTRNIDDIDDIFEMVATMKALGIDAKGLNTLEEMKAKVNQSICSSPTHSNKLSTEKVFSVFERAKDEDTRKRKGLQKLFDETNTCIRKFDERALAVLDRTVKDVKQKMLRHLDQLEPKQYFILVAGETSAGKSSFLNLLMGEELLPYSTLSTTSTICELKYALEPKLVVYYKNDRSPQTIKLNLKGKSYLEQIRPYVHKKEEREAGSALKKVEVFWPHELLKKGIVVIDSPGVGESAIMDEMVQNYLPEAFAFIYIINSHNAGGIQHDRIGKLLERVRTISAQREEQFPSKCALFVCNKWDMVPPNETHEVKRHVIKSLKKCWPDLDPEAQIVYISTTGAYTAQAHGVLTNEFQALIKRLKSMILKSIDERLYSHWRWLTYVLSRMIFFTYGFIRNAEKSGKEVVGKIQIVTSRIQQIEEEHDAVLKTLHIFLDEEIGKAVTDLSKYLRSNEVMTQFRSWTVDDAVEKAETWEVTRFNILKALENRLRCIVEDWEEQNQVFTKTRAKLIDHVLKRWNLVEARLHHLEKIAVEDERSGGYVQDSFDDNFSLSTGEKVIIGVTSPVWVPLTLAAGILSVPILGVLAIKNKISNANKLKTYAKDKCAFLSVASEIYLTEMTTGTQSLQTFVASKLEEAHLYLRQMQARIPAIIAADKIFMFQLQNETRSKEEVQKFYYPITEESKSIQARASMFGINNVRPYDIEPYNLKWKQDRQSLLGQGSFGAVYKGKLRQGECDVEVAMKLSISIIDAKNVTYFLSEEDALRKLEHRNIVKYYGTSLLNEKAGKRSIFVMELCKTSLRYYIDKNPNKVPGRSGKKSSVTQAIEWATNIIDGLLYIHDNGIVHRDLKLDNILVANNGSAKIADVGLAKGVVDITGTVAGTFMYMAPEVLASETYCLQADIYSLGMILWEIWFGGYVFSDINLNCNKHLEMLRRGKRPSLEIKDHHNPIPEWKTLTEKCWSTNPKDRPTIDECRKSALAWLKHIQ